MRARSIKPGICDNEVLGTADPFCTLLFERLWMMADREGRLEDRPLRIRAKAFPYREGLDCDALLTWLHDNGFIQRYEVDGKRFLQIIEFVKHQKPHANEVASVIPAPREAIAPKVEELPPMAEVLPPTEQALGSYSLNPSSLTASSLNPCNAREAEALWPKIRTEYPKGIYRESEWLVAEHAYRRLIDDGEPPDKLFEAVTLYRAQQLAKRSIGTQFVLSPSKFFGEQHWRGPFPMPRSKADVRLAGNVAVMQEFVEGSTQ